jgi:hypothetical protein
MSGFVYVWFDKAKKMYYVGSHWGSEEDGYICSSVWMNRAYSKRPFDFKRKIVSKISSSREDMIIEERRWLNMIKDEELRKRYYNLRKVAGHWSMYTHRDTIGRISEGTKRAMQRPDVIENYRVGLAKRNTRSSDPEVRAKRSESMKKTLAAKRLLREVA